MGSCDFEAVSALVDGELGEQECEVVLRHLNECRQCCHLFERFHAARNLVRGEGRVPIPSDFCERISAAIAEEHPPGSGSEDPGSSRGAFRPLWGWLAAAAGLTVVVAAGGLLWPQAGTGPASAPSTPGSLARSSEPAPAPQTATSQSPSPESENVAAIQRYLSEHSGFVPSGPGAEFQRTRLEVERRQ